MTAVLACGCLLLAGALFAWFRVPLWGALAIGVLIVSAAATVWQR